MRVYLAPRRRAFQKQRPAGLRHIFAFLSQRPRLSSPSKGSRELRDERQRGLRGASGDVPGASVLVHRLRDPHSGPRPRHLAATLLVYPYAADGANRHRERAALREGHPEQGPHLGIAKHIRAVHVTQGFLNRILGVGTIQVSTAGDQPEFTVADMPDPGEIREAISRRRTPATGTRRMPSPQDDRDRKEAARLLLAAAMAILLLIAIVAVGIYFVRGSAAAIRSRRVSASRARRWSPSASRWR